MLFRSAKEFSDIQKLADYTAAAFEELRAAFGEFTTNELAAKKKKKTKKLTAAKKRAIPKPPKPAAAKPARAAIKPAEAGKRPPPKRVARKAVAA